MIKFNMFRAVLAAMVCLVAAPCQGEPGLQKPMATASTNQGVIAGPLLRASADRARDEVTARNEVGRPLGTLGKLYLLLAGLGFLAVTAAGLLLIIKRPASSDGPYLLLGAIGYVLLITAAVGLLLLIH